MVHKLQDENMFAVVWRFRVKVWLLGERIRDEQ